MLKKKLFLFYDGYLFLSNIIDKTKKEKTTEGGKEG